jgi:hypothetical protein
MYSTNAEFEDGGYKLKDKPNGAPSNYYHPPMTSISGSNYFDRESSTLYVLIRGSEPIEIHTTPVIQVEYEISNIN